MQQCIPFLHLPFVTSILQPLFWLKAQQIAWPSASLCAKPFSSLGHIAFAFAEVLGLLVGLVIGPVEAFGAAVAGLDFSGSLALPLDIGSKNIVTLGSVLNSFSLTSIGKFPWHQVGHLEVLAP